MTDDASTSNTVLDRKIHKNVRSKDWIDLGNVIPESSDTFTVMQGASRGYNNIPKCVI